MLSYVRVLYNSICLFVVEWANKIILTQNFFFLLLFGCHLFTILCELTCGINFTHGRKSKKYSKRVLDSHFRKAKESERKLLNFIVASSVLVFFGGWKNFRKNNL